MNLTLSLDEQIVQRARQRAQAQGKSLNQLIREFLEELGGQPPAEGMIEQLRKLRRAGAGNSSGQKIRREDAYD